MSLTEKELNERFSVLVDGQRRLAHYVAQGKTDDEIAQFLEMPVESVVDAVRVVAERLRVSGEEYREVRMSLAGIARQFFHDEEQAMGRPAEPQIGSLPNVHELVRRIRHLSHRDRSRLQTVVNAPRGEGANTAKELGLAQTSLNAIISSIYRKLELPNVRERKKLLQHAFSIIRGESARSAAIEDIGSDTSAADDDNEEGVQVSKSLAPPAAPQPQLEEAESRPPPAALPHRANGFGAGVVLPIPPDTVHVDVVSGEFQNKQPSPDLKRQIQERRREGLKPTFVVLYPSGEDSSVVRGHLVFLEREGK